MRWDLSLGLGSSGGGELHIINRLLFDFVRGRYTYLNGHAIKIKYIQQHLETFKTVMQKSMMTKVARASPRCKGSDSRLTSSRGVTYVLSLKTTHMRFSCSVHVFAATQPLLGQPVRNLSTRLLTIDYSLSQRAYEHKYTNTRRHQQYLFAKRIDNPMLYNELTVLTGTPNPCKPKTKPSPKDNKKLSDPFVSCGVNNSPRHTHSTAHHAQSP